MSTFLYGLIVTAAGGLFFYFYVMYAFWRMDLDYDVYFGWDE